MNSTGRWGFPGGSVGKNQLVIQEMWVQSMGWEDPLKKEMTTHSSILAWGIPWTEEPGGYNWWGHKESNTTKWLSTHALVGDIECLFPPRAKFRRSNCCISFCWKDDLVHPVTEDAAFWVSWLDVYIKTWLPSLYGVKDQAPILPRLVTMNPTWGQLHYHFTYNPQDF